MKKFSFSFLKLEYDEYGRLHLKSFKNVRTNKIDYLVKKRIEFYSNFDKETQVHAEYNMNTDVLTFSNNLGTYQYSISPLMKKYIKSLR